MHVGFLSDCLPLSALALGLAATGRRLLQLRDVIVDDLVFQRCNLFPLTSIQSPYRTDR